ncbi:MAG: hypothetical protein AB7I18_15095 [Candidatus Berkiella sp.]
MTKSDDKRVTHVGHQAWLLLLFFGGGRENPLNEGHFNFTTRFANWQSISAGPVLADGGATFLQRHGATAHQRYAIYTNEE